MPFLRMGQGACGGYQRSPSAIKSGEEEATYHNNNNMSSVALLERKIAALEEKLRQKDNEVEGLQVSSTKILV